MLYGGRKGWEEGEEEKYDGMEGGGSGGRGGYNDTGKHWMEELMKRREIVDGQMSFWRNDNFKLETKKRENAALNVETTAYATLMLLHGGIKREDLIMEIVSWLVGQMKSDGNFFHQTARLLVS